LVSLDDAVIARLKKGEEHFEILVDPYAAADLIDGKEKNFIQKFATDSTSKDSKKGTNVPQDSLSKF
jgi:ribosome maturation protein SDO1